jgi:hypothetical protein
MKVSFVAGFGPIIREADAAHAFWRDGLGIAFEEPAPGYLTNDDLDGVKAFAMWPLSQAAEATFGSPDWPADLPVPQAWIELDVESPDAVGTALEAGQVDQLVIDETAPVDEELRGELIRQAALTDASVELVREHAGLLRHAGVGATLRFRIEGDRSEGRLDHS